MTKPVEAVTGSQQNINTPVNSSPQNAAELPGLFDSQQSPLLRYNNMYAPLYGLGSSSYNKKIMSAYTNEISQSANNYENSSLTKVDQKNLRPLSERIDEFRVLGYRLHSDEEVTDTLKGAAEKGKGVELYLTNCAEDGLIDEKGDVSFYNLKNKTRAVDTLITPMHIFTPDADENISILNEIAIKERSPELAACLLEETSKSGLMGTDNKTAEDLLINSRKYFNSDEEHSNFVTDIDKAYQGLFGITLDEHFKREYKTVGQKAAIIGGVAAGTIAVGSVAAKCKSGFLSKTLKTVGKVAKKAGSLSAEGLQATGKFLMKGNSTAKILGLVALAGYGIYSLNWFGKNEKGEKLLNTTDNSRQTDTDIDYQGYGMGYGTGFRKPCPAS